MSFNSRYSHLIWDSLRTVLVPDQMTLQPEYLRKFGTYSSGNAEVDKMMSNNLTTVMIPISTILTYFEDGVEIQIPKREDMVQIHKDIELYLNEWREHIKYDINLDIESNKKLVNDLSKLSKYIYDRTKPSEVFDNLLLSNSLGIVSPSTRIREEKEDSTKTKPDYEGISNLIRSKTSKPRGRFG